MGFSFSADTYKELTGYFPFRRTSYIPFVHNFLLPRNFDKSKNTHFSIQKKARLNCIKKDYLGIEVSPRDTHNTYLSPNADQIFYPLFSN